jgi:hypothetical protein
MLVSKKLYILGSRSMGLALRTETREGTMSALGLVSRALPVQTACATVRGFEGRSFEFDNQVLISSHRKLL